MLYSSLKSYTKRAIFQDSVKISLYNRNTVQKIDYQNLKKIYNLNKALLFQGP